MLDAILFDFDGVLVESTDIKTQAFRALFRDYPEHVDAIAALHQANTGIDRYVKFEMIHRDILHLPLDPPRTAELARRFADLVVEQVVACRMVAGALESLKALKGRIPLAIVSGTPETELVQIVERRGLASYFVAVRGSPKDKTTLIRELLAQGRWRPDRVIMLGDAMADFDSAANNGVSFVGRAVPGVPNPFPTGTRVVSDLIGLPGVLGLSSATVES